MYLKSKEINIFTGGPLIIALNSKDANELDLQAADRVLLKKGKKEIIVSINISESSKKIKPGTIGLFEEVTKILKPKNGELIKIKPTHTPKSVELIKNKLDGKALSKEEINVLVKDLSENDLTETELAYFVSGCYHNSLSQEETTNFTKAVLRGGKKLKFRSKIVADKHCLGGIPNNRTTMLITPILAAAGVTMAKSSSRSITSAAGTADTMESLANVSFTIKKIKNIVKKTKGCIIWGGAMELAGADDKLIKVRYPLRLDPEGLMLASIMAKKASVGSTHVLIDIPIGKTAKITTKRKARKLRRKFINLGKNLGMKVQAIITEGDQPIGNGIGPNLEARDILYILKRHPGAPRDLEEKSIMMADKLLKMSKNKSSAREILESGKAYSKMKEIIREQGGKSTIAPEEILIGKYSLDIKSTKSGRIIKINNKSCKSCRCT